MNAKDDKTLVRHMLDDLVASGIYEDIMSLANKIARTVGPRRWPTDESVGDAGTAITEELRSLLKIWVAVDREYYREKYSRRC